MQLADQCESDHLSGEIIVTIIVSGEISVVIVTIIVSGEISVVIVTIIVFGEISVLLLLIIAQTC